MKTTVEHGVVPYISERLKKESSRCCFERLSPAQIYGVGKRPKTNSVSFGLNGKGKAFDFPLSTRPEFLGLERAARSFSLIKLESSNAGWFVLSGAPVMAANGKKRKEHTVQYTKRRGG